MEVEDHDLLGLVWHGLPFAYVDGIYRRLYEEGMTAKSLSRFCGAIGKHHGFNLDGSSEPHVAGKTGIGWDNLRDDFAPGLRLILLGAG